jgi:DNA-binding PadR family transcriptional regulator
VASRSIIYIYPALIQLEDEGYIELVIIQQKDRRSTKGAGEKSRRPYRVSKKGIEVLKDYDRIRKEWLENVSQLRRMWL